MVNGSDRLSSRFRTSFVGRSHERETLSESLLTSNFTIVRGPGGVGKTRLVAVVADDVSPSFADGVVHVAVDDVSDCSRLCAAISGAVGMRDSDPTTWQNLSHFLHARRVLLILDGCELLDRDCLVALQDLLESTDDLTIAATTRRLLHVDGARNLMLAPLSVPPADDEISAEVASRQDVESFDAVQLFVARARLVRPEFAATADNAETVAELCRRLDGLPLALELAAPWVRALSVEQILERMRQIPDFLRAGAGNVVPRHQTLSSLVEGTYELCSDTEKALWARLGIFAGSFDLNAVEAVCAGLGLDAIGVVDTVASLLDQSVLVVSEGAGSSRYRMLRIARDYAKRHVGDDSDELIEWHRAHFAAVVDRAVDRWAGPDQFRLVDQLQADYPNILIAIDAGLGHPATAIVSARMAADLWALWFIEGRLSEGRTVLGRVAASRHLDPHDPMRVRALYLNSYLCVLQGRIKAAEEVHDLAVSHDTGEDRINRGLRPHVEVIIGMGRDDVSEATSLVSQALDIYGEVDDPRARVWTLDAIGIAILAAALGGETARANDLGRRGVTECIDVGDVEWRGYIDYALGVDGWMRGDHDRARRAAVAVLGSSRDHLLVTHCIEMLAWCAARDRHFPRAAQLLGAADQRWEYLGGHHAGFWALSVHRDRCETEVRQELSAARYASEYGDGRRLTGDMIFELMTAGLGDSGRAASHEELPLTARELEVASLLADGRSNREIAVALTISPRTAESHVDHILTKLNLANRTQVATWVVARAARYDRSA